MNKLYYKPQKLYTTAKSSYFNKQQAMSCYNCKPCNQFITKIKNYSKRNI